MRLEKGDSPAWRVLREAIELDIAEESPYPEVSAFIDGGTPHTERQIEEALQSGYAAVVAFPDGGVQVTPSRQPASRLAARSQLPH
jgi:hypothetical protein